MNNKIILNEEEQQIEFESVNEPWLTYKLADGNEIDVRMMLTSVKRVPSPDPNNPAYQIQWGGVMRVRKAGKLGPEKMIQ